MRKFRLRNLLERLPFFDGLRLSVLSGVCHHGTNFFGRSYPVSKVVASGARRFLDGGEQAIFAIYHGRMVGLLDLTCPRHKLTVLISNSRDGEIIGRAVQELGFSSARGSASRGAVEGGMQLVRAARQGQHLVMMVDGPRGPVFEVKPGVVRIAEITGLPIIPFVCTARSTYWMWGWDRFLAPLWSTPLIYLVGEPMFVAPEATDIQKEEIRLELEREMNRLRHLSDAFWQVNAGYPVREAIAPPIPAPCFPRVRFMDNQLPGAQG